MDFEKLEAKVKNIESGLLAFLKGPQKQQKEKLDAALLEIAALKTKVEALEKAGIKAKRKAMNYEDWETIQGEITEDMTAKEWRAVAERTGIPDSTARKYARLSPEAVEKLRQEQLKESGVTDQ